MIVVDRPGWDNQDFGKTRATRHPDYVYSNIGALVHRVRSVTLNWWEVCEGGCKLRRREAPVFTYHTVCGMQFGSNTRHGATLCAIPKPDAELCGRCQGKPPTFSKDGPQPERRDAVRRLGCVEEVS